MLRDTASPPGDEAPPETPLRVSLDGGLTYAPAPQGVRVVYEEVPVPGEDDPEGELHINCTEEGLILDVWASREESLDTHLGTASWMVDELARRLVERGA